MVLAHQIRPDQNLRIGNERGNRMTRLTVEGELNYESVFLDDPAAGRRGSHSAHRLIIEFPPQLPRQFQIAIESGVNDRGPMLPSDFEPNHGHAVIGYSSGNHRRPPLR